MHLLYDLLLFWKHNTQFVKWIARLRKVKQAKPAKILPNALASFDSKKTPPKSQFFVQQSLSTREVQGIDGTHIKNTVYKGVFYGPAVLNFLCICKNKISP